MSAWFRIYRRGSRTPRDYMGRVQANSEGDAVLTWLRQSGSKILAGALEAVPARVKPVPRVPGK